MAAKKPAAERLAALPGGSAKTRLRALRCVDACGYPPVRCSRKAIEHGLPMCPCGAQLAPWDLEDLALALSAGSMSADQWAAHPLVMEFQREYERVTRGQQGHRKRGMAALDSPDAIATLRVMSSVSEDAGKARLNAARSNGALKAARELSMNGSGAPTRAPMTKESDPIPF